MGKRGLLIIFSILLLLSLGSAVLAHSEGEAPTVTQKQGVDWTSPIPYIILSGIWLVILTIFSIISGDKIENYKKLVFLMMVIPVVLSSLYLAGDTIYGNVISETGGPVHWHADYEVWVCGEKLDFADPGGLKSKIGSSTFHEHNDDRVHFEGTPKKISDINLKNYFSIIGGELNQGHIIYPTNDKIIEYKDNDACPGESLGTLKVYINGELEEDFEDYVIYPDSSVPPGDCVIIVFDETSSDLTEKVCTSWQVAGLDYSSFERKEITIGDRTWA